MSGNISDEDMRSAVTVLLKPKVIRDTYENGYERESASDRMTRVVQFPGQFDRATTHLAQVAEDIRQREIPSKAYRDMDKRDDTLVCCQQLLRDWIRAGSAYGIPPSALHLALAYADYRHACRNFAEKNYTDEVAGRNAEDILRLNPKLGETLPEATARRLIAAHLSYRANELGPLTLRAMVWAEPTAIYAVDLAQTHWRKVQEKGDSTIMYFGGMRITSVLNAVADKWPELVSPDQAPDAAQARQNARLRMAELAPQMRRHCGL
ncbi:MAG: hypothetical protein IPI58_06515 [Alphaproteobacteria bacterium]|nr:MAG: hypothetical protein IPI58_06515 [Alphaproteobacteria bacterium]